MKSRFITETHLCGESVFSTPYLRESRNIQRISTILTHFLSGTLAGYLRQVAH